MFGTPKKERGLELGTIGLLLNIDEFPALLLLGIYLGKAAKWSKLVPLLTTIELVILKEDSLSFSPNKPFELWLNLKEAS